MSSIAKTAKNSAHLAGNLIFLPIGASVIDISPVNHEDKKAWVFFMAADFHVLRINPIKIPEQRPVPMLHRLTTYKQWHQLPIDARSSSSFLELLSSIFLYLLSTILSVFSLPLSLALFLFSLSLSLLSYCVCLFGHGRFEWPHCHMTCNGGGVNAICD